MNNDTKKFVEETLEKVKTNLGITFVELMDDTDLLLAFMPVLNVEGVSELTDLMSEDSEVIDYIRDLLLEKDDTLSRNYMTVEDGAFKKVGEFTEEEIQQEEANNLAHAFATHLRSLDLDFSDEKNLEKIPELFSEYVSENNISVDSNPFIKNLAESLKTSEQEES